LDVDSDNNNGSNPPGRTDAEDRIENVTGDPQKPGKLLGVNDDDNDGDRIPDFADGFNLDGNAGNNDDSNASEHFVPLVLELPEPIDLRQAKVKFTYSASNPAGVQRAGMAPNFVYTPASGHLRIWKKNGNQARNEANANAGGDYVAPGIEYRPAQLGFSNTRVVRLYLEGIASSSAVAGDQIKVIVDPDGPGPIPFLPQDAVRVTVTMVDLTTLPHNSEVVVSDQDEENPGVFLVLNDDDDDGDGNQDNSNNLIEAADDDWALMTLVIEPWDIRTPTIINHVALKKERSGHGDVRVFDITGGEAPLDFSDPLNPPTWDVEDLPRLLYVEGLATSSTPRDVILKAYWQTDGVELCLDIVKISVVRASE
jgi:hypothetical protein